MDAKQLRKHYRKGTRVMTPFGSGVTTSFQYTSVKNRGPVCVERNFEHFASVVVKLDRKPTHGSLCNGMCSGAFNCVCCDNNIAWIEIRDVQRID